MSEGVEVRYGLHPRTIRGFRDLRKKWNAALEPGQAFSVGARKSLQDILRDHQTENPEIIGSVRLFAALLDEPNWLIWRPPSLAQVEEWSSASALPADAEFCDDPLQASPKNGSC